LYVVVAILVVSFFSLFYGCRFTVTACSTCIKYVAYFVEHGRAEHTVSAKRLPPSPLLSLLPFMLLIIIIDV